jgi:predicted amidohydrolase YtcJ
MPSYAQGKIHADLLLTNGKIITVDAAFRIHSALAIQGERILAVGDDADLQSFCGPNTQVIDLQGKTVLPGLIDSHTHPANASIIEFDHEIPQMESIQDVLDYIQSRAAVLKEGEWIRVSQVFLTRLREQRYPTRQELDQAAPNHPCIFRTGPDASVNTLALQRSGIDKDWKVDDGGPGYAETDPDTGELTGILRSCTRYLKYESPEKSPSKDEEYDLLKKMFADYNRVGVTGVGERDAEKSEIALYQRLYDNGELTVRSFLSKHVDTIQSIEAMRADIQKIKASPLYAGDQLLRVAAAKTYLDGGMLTGSAYMREPWGVSKLYNISDPDYRGLRFIPEEKLIPLIECCMENDVQYMAHTVGDGAVHAFIDACAKLKNRFDIRAKRPVICHSNFMSEEAVNRAAELGICMDIQPAWLHLDGRTLHHHFGYDRLAWFQPLRSIFAIGGMTGGGSDHMQKLGSLRSINFYDPWLGMWTTMTRKAKWLDTPLHPEQALSRVEAIRFYTINNAYLHFAEHERGSLEAGKLADFIIISDDILTCPLDQIKEIRVLKTYLGGKAVYES